MKNVLFSILSLLIIIGCNSDPDEIVQPSQAQYVNFSALKAGQTSSFQRYSLQCFNADSSFFYTTDTLILEVIQDGPAWIFKESLTEGSPMYKDGIFVNPVFYPVQDQETHLTLPDRSESALFFFYGSDTLYKSPAGRIPLQQDQCRLLLDNQPFIGDEIGEVDSFELGDFQLINQTAVSCVPLFYPDLEAYLLYDGERFSASHTISTGGIISQTFGWVLIE